MNKVDIIYESLNRFSFLKSKIESLRSLRILYYHRINYKLDNYYFDTGISLDTFKKQILYFKYKYKIISLSKAIKKAENGESLQGYMVITFDDGFAECYTYIYPFLKEHNIPATYYLIENTLNNKDLMWRNKLVAIENIITPKKKKLIVNQLAEKQSRELDLSKSLLEISNLWEMKEKDELANFLWNQAQIGTLEGYLAEYQPYLMDSQVFEMLENNQEIGSHTNTHPFCSKLSKEEVYNEIILSVKSLNNKFDSTIQSLSYPFGDRASEEMEQYIMDNTNINTFLGIEDRISNLENKAKWERVGLEKEYNRSMIAFYLKPFINKIRYNF